MISLRFYFPPFILTLSCMLSGCLYRPFLTGVPGVSDSLEEARSLKVFVAEYQEVAPKTVYADQVMIVEAWVEHVWYPGSWVWQVERSKRLRCCLRVSDVAKREIGSSIAVALPGRRMFGGTAGTNVVEYVIDEAPDSLKLTLYRYKEVRPFYGSSIAEENLDRLQGIVLVRTASVE